jgi:amino acid permease
MKAVERAKLVRSLRQESRRLRLLVAVILFFLLTLTFVVVSRPDALLFTRTRAATIFPPSSFFSPYQCHQPSPARIHFTVLTGACALPVSLQ